MLPRFKKINKHSQHLTYYPNGGDIRKKGKKKKLKHFIERIKHRKRNSKIEQTKTGWKSSNDLQLRIFKLFGHISRNEGSIERLVVQGQVEGKRARGRSPTRWIDTVKSLTQTTVVECFRHATNRQQWRRLAQEAVQSNDAMKFISVATTTLLRVHD
ncbi:jg11615 [Pararge aegeria aegeria]|uniref:Jg11615 protein n=1 Tax=Pararge aegeria aegeria TaxID=348720 RepID=A0A8S4S1P1_9NEOP|nr:jg11615 [Pararge aegeria aegeria]